MLKQAAQTYRFITAHPFNQNRKLRALYNWFRWQIRSRVSNEKLTYKLVDDTLVYARSGMTGITGNIYCGLHEWEEMGFVLHLLRATDVFADVGANVGVYTLLASGGAGAFTESFEPIPGTYQNLVDNIALNRLEERVTAHNIGVSDKEDILFFTNALDTVNHVTTASDTGAIQVPVKSLDEVIRRTPTLIKIDVEGYEYQVLAGATMHLASDLQHAVLVEWDLYGNKFGFGKEEISALLQGHGYFPVTYDPWTREIHPISPDRIKNNGIFLKDLGYCRERVRSARTYHVQERRV